MSSVAALTGACAIAFSQTPSLTLIGVPAGRLDSLITGMSADGTVFSGYTQATGGVRRGFTWTRAGGFDEWGASPNVPLGTRGLALSGDGSTVVGRRESAPPSPQAFRYRGGTYSTLGTYPSGYDISVAAGVNNNGSLIVGTIEDSTGLRGTNAMRWTAATGMQNIGRAQPNHAGANFTGVSRDGSTTIGVSFPGGVGGRAYSWTESGGWRFLSPPSGIGSVYDASTTGVSFNGSLIVGYVDPLVGALYQQAVLWNNGMPTALGSFGDRWASSANGVSDDGRIVVGGTENVDTRIPVATIWLDGSGAINLQDYLSSLGVSTPQGWRLSVSGDVSADGTTISGLATDGIRLQGFIATIPTPAVFAPLTMTFLIAPRRRRPIA